MTKKLRTATPKTEGTGQKEYERELMRIFVEATIPGAISYGRLLVIVALLSQPCRSFYIFTLGPRGVPLCICLASSSPRFSPRYQSRNI